jgi:PKD repeat protein
VRRARSLLAATFLLGVVALLLVPPSIGRPAGASSPLAPPTSPASSASAPPSPRPAAAPTPAVDPSTSGFNCTALGAGWALVSGVQPAPSVADALQTPCTVGHDAPALYFVSNASDSGSDVRFTLALPANGTPSASTATAYWMGMWAKGLDCSYGGGSYLTVELLPPYDSEPGVPASPDWQVRAPIWDLVPAGACDTQCENDTAFFTVEGLGYCEDDAFNLISNSMGSLAAVEGAFRPGDLLTVDLTGEGGRLSVRVNDTTDPSLDLAWDYGAETNSANLTFAPRYSSASTASGGWTGGLNVGVGEMTCPIPADGDEFPSACNSYSAPWLNLTPSPELLGVASWNATTHAFSNRYPAVETISSSGACSGLAGVPACADFAAYGGTRTYPTIGLSSIDGRAWYSIGANSSEVRNSFGGPASEYPANGSLSGLRDPTTLSATTSVASADVDFDIRAIDPNQVQSVVVASWWCTRNLSRITLAYPAILSGTGINTSFDGNWTVAVPLGTPGATGRFFYSVLARSETGAYSPYLYGSTVITTGAGGPCGASSPAPPGFTGSDIAAIGGGYTLQWNESGLSAPRNFTIVATPSAGGANVRFFEGNVTSARITGLAGNTSYNLEVIAYNAQDLPGASPTIDAGATLYPLLLRAPVVNASSAWINQTTVRITASADGGAPLFDFEATFGDGTSAFENTSGDEATFVHYYGGDFTGNAVVLVSVTDSVGDFAEAAPVFVPIRGTPLAVPATISAGDGHVDLHWSPPIPPTVNASALAPTSYDVFWTTNATWAPFLTGGLTDAFGGATADVPGVTVESYGPGKTISPYSVPNGVTAYAQIVAVNAYGNGRLGAVGPDELSPVLSATAQALLPSPGDIVLENGAGGPAPFVEGFNSSFTMSPGTAITSATYRFSNGAFVDAAIWQGNGFAWANASYTFDTPGTYTVLLYVLDSVADEVVISVGVIVTVGPAPVVSASVAPSPIWENTSATLSATASAGSGHYNYSWVLGNTTIGTTGNITFVFADPGTYLVDLSVTDTIWGGVTSEVVPVTVLATPTVDIVATATGSAGGYRFSAIVLNGYGNFSYTWIFDDGTQGSGVSVSHTYASAGTYTVTVEAKDGYGHVVTASVVVVYGGTTITQAASSGVPLEEVYFLLGLIVALAALALLLFVRGRRTPSAEAAPAEAPTYGEDVPAPEPNYEEEPPPLH